MITWTIHQLSKNYGKKTALFPLNLELRPGIYALLGPNGAGKSTMMNILAGVLKPTTGEILVNGRVRERKEYQSLIGYLPQKFGCYDSFSGLDMLYYFAALKGLPFNEKLGKRIHGLAGLFELEEDLNRRVREYSGGMRQRLGIIQAFLGNPHLIILDEPTAGLDPKQRIYFRTLLQKAGRKRIILLSTHILSDVQDLADSILILRQGRLMSEMPNNEDVEKVYMEFFNES